MSTILMSLPNLVAASSGTSESRVMWSGAPVFTGTVVMPSDPKHTESAACHQSRLHKRTPPPTQVSTFLWWQQPRCWSSFSLWLLFFIYIIVPFLEMTRVGSSIARAPMSLRCKQRWSSTTQGIKSIPWTNCGNIMKTLCRGIYIRTIHSSQRLTFTWPSSTYITTPPMRIGHHSWR